MAKFDDSSRGYRVDLRNGTRISPDSEITTFKLFELKKFSFTPFSKVTRKYEFDRSTGRYFQSIEDFVRANPYGRIDTDYSKSSYIFNKYVYIFERRQNSGEVKLACELKGISDSKMEFEKYKPDRSKEATITEVDLATKLNGEYVQYYFILSGFRLTDARIEVIVKQLINAHGGSGFFSGAINMPRVATFTSLKYANYSPFNHILFKEEQQFPNFVPVREDNPDDKNKFFVYLTDMTQLSFKIYNKFLEAHACYLDWTTKQREEKAQKLNYIRTITEQLIQIKEGKATRHLAGSNNFDDVKVPFKLDEIDLQIDYSTTRAALSLVFNPDLKDRLRSPDEIFQLEERLSYAEWKKRYDEVSTFYYQTTFSWGLALLRVITSFEFIHQATDYVSGSHQGSGGNEYTIDDIETGKPNRDGFDKEEGKAIYSNINGMQYAALSKFPGTVGFLKDSFETVFGVFDHIYTGDYDLEKLFEDPKNLVPKNAVLAVFLGKKATAGLAEFIDVLVTVNTGKVESTIKDITRGQIDVEDNLRRLRGLKEEYSNTLELLNKYRTQNAENGRKLSQLQERTRTTFHRKRMRLEQLRNIGNRYRRALIKREWKKVLLHELKEEIVEYINDSFKLNLSLDDMKLDEMGNLVSITTEGANGRTRTLKSDHFTLIRDTKAKIESNSLHKSLVQAEDDLKQGMLSAYESTKKKASEALRERESFANKDYHDIYWETDRNRRRVEELRNQDLNAETKKKITEGMELEQNLEVENKKLSNLDAWGKVKNSLTILNFIFESINLGFAIYDAIVSANSDEFSARDAIGLSGSALDFTSSVIDVVDLINKWKPMKIFSNIEKSGKLLRFGNFIGKFATGIGIASGVIDFYMDASQIPGNWQEGDDWGVAGNAISAYGGLLSVVGGILFLSGAGTVVVAVVTIAGILYQIGGTLIDNLLGGDRYELWLRHTCWGNEFGKKETNFIFFEVDQPAWAVVNFDQWAYKSEDELSKPFGWAGRMDAQIDSFQHLIYYYGFSLSACKDIYQSYILEHTRTSSRQQRQFSGLIKGGYISVTLSIPPMANPLSCFIISVWLEDDSGSRQEHLVQDKRLMLMSRTKIGEVMKGIEEEDPILHGRLNECTTSDDYIFAGIEKINDASCVVLRLLDSDIVDEDSFGTAVMSGHPYRTTYKEFYGYKNGDEVIRVNRLKDRLTKEGSGIWTKLAASVQLDVNNDGKLVMPQYGDMQIPKIIKLSLNDIGRELVAMGRYVDSAPLSYCYDMLSFRQLPGTIKDNL